MDFLAISRPHSSSDALHFRAIRGGDVMNQMTVNQGCILHHLKRHQGLKASEIAEDMECEVKDAESDLNALLNQGLAIEEYATEVGYVWRAIA